MTDRRVVWRDGALVPSAEATVHVLSHAAARGSQVFDVLRVEITDDGPCAVGLRPHVVRFLRSAELMGMVEVGEIADLERAVALTLVANRAADPGQAGPWVVKLMAVWVEPGVGVLPASLRPQVVIAAFPANPDAVDPVGPPVSLRSSVMPKMPARILPASLKVAAAYTPAVREHLAARSAGFDHPVFRTESGDLAESTSSSILVIRNERLLAPPLDSVLDGISRRAVFDAAQTLSLPLDVRPVSWDEVEAADELILSSTNHAVTPVAQLDDRAFEAPGPVTAKIGQVITDVYRGDHPLSDRWLTPLSPLAAD